MLPSSTLFTIDSLPLESDLPNYKVLLLPRVLMVENFENATPGMAIIPGGRGFFL
jgi:hypothetical protein